MRDQIIESIIRYEDKYIWLKKAFINVQDKTSLNYHDCKGYNNIDILLVLTMNNFHHLNGI